LKYNYQESEFNIVAEGFCEDSIIIHSLKVAYPDELSFFEPIPVGK
jgi:hypothetical protein